MKKTLATIALVASLLGCKEGHRHEPHEESSQAAEPPHPDEVSLSAEAATGVRLDKVRSLVLQPRLTAPARVAFNGESMAQVGSPLRGRAVEIQAKLGSHVKRGDTLLIVESPELGEAQAEFLQKRIAAQAAEPASELARAAWERARGLHEKSEGMALSEVQRRETEYRAAAAGLAAARAAAVAAENRLHLLGMSQEAAEALARTGEISARYGIPAPIDGQVIEREVTLGELVGPDREALMVLADNERLWVLADIPEARLAEILPGATAWVSVGGMDAPRVQGRVMQVAPMVDPATRSGQVRIEVAGSDARLFPGMFARAEIEAGPRPGAVRAISDAAVQLVEGRTCVFVPVANEPNTFTPRAVSVGRPIAGLVQVHSGLVDGEEFVAEGSFLLKADLGKGHAAHEH